MIARARMPVRTWCAPRPDRMGGCVDGRCHADVTVLSLGERGYVGHTGGATCGSASVARRGLPLTAVAHPACARWTLRQAGRGDARGQHRGDQDGGRVRHRAHTRKVESAEIFYKDWGSGQPVVFSPGWPLNAHAWADQLMAVAANSYRAIAHDRRGHGRSSQTWTGNDMDTYADDLAVLIEVLDLRDA